MTERIYAAQAAEMIGRSKSTLIRYQDEGRFPDLLPDLRDPVSGWRVYDPEKIRALAALLTPKPVEGE